MSERVVVTESRPPQLILGVSLKLYLTIAESVEWARGVAQIVNRHPAVLSGAVQVFALPSLTALHAVQKALGDSPVAVGAQDAHWADRGAYTGAISPADLREVGCQFVEVGHAERRSLFGESDEIVARKFASIVRNRLTPVLCVGEDVAGDVHAAVTACASQLAVAIGRLESSIRTDIVVAYEPVWAIGQSAPAPAAHVQAVTEAIRDTLAAHPQIENAWVIYGGSAQTGFLSQLGDSVDGLFLGRFAHDPAEFAKILDEAAALLT